MINIFDGFQRKAIELMNNVNEIIKIRSTLDLRKFVFSNRVHNVCSIHFVVRALFKKILPKILPQT